MTELGSVHVFKQDNVLEAIGFVKYQGKYILNVVTDSSGVTFHLHQRWPTFMRNSEVCCME